jgi:hypothetical protein
MAGYFGRSDGEGVGSRRAMARENVLGARSVAATFAGRDLEKLVKRLWALSSCRSPS